MPPQIGVSTKFVYENLKLDADTVHPDIDGLIGAIRAKNLEQIAGHMGNVLETVTIPNYPVIAEIKEHMMSTVQRNDEREAVQRSLACLPTGIQPWLHTRQCVNQILQNRFT